MPSKQRVLPQSLIIMNKSQEPMIFHGRQKLTPVMKLSSQKICYSSKYMLYTGKSSWRASGSQVSTNNIQKFVFEGGSVCAYLLVNEKSRCRDG